MPLDVIVIDSAPETPTETERTARRGIVRGGEFMPKAVWEGTVIAESDQCVVVEGNQYFPIESVHKEFLQPVDKTTVCGWKGIANYYDVVVGGKRNPGAAWYYADPKSAASEIKGRVAFWKGVRVE